MSGKPGMRSIKIRHDENTRHKIQAAYLINRLQDHVKGVVDLSQTQVRAAEILLRKILPDLALIDHTGEVAHNFIEAPAVLTEEQWLAKRAIVSGEPSPDRNLH